MAETTVEWSEEEYRQLIDTLKKVDKENKTRDGVNYLLKRDTDAVPIDLDKVPAKYVEVFDSLKSNLKPQSF